MGLFTYKCAACGERVRRGSKFCPHCGKGASAGKVACASCSSLMPAGGRFCPSCGAPGATRTDVVSNRWLRPPGDFAVRVEASQLDPNTWWRDKQLTVEHGTRALIFQGGAYVGEVPEGRYDMGGFLKKLNNFMVDQGMVAILVDDGDITLDLERGGLRSKDGFDLGVRLRLVLRVVNPHALFVNFMKGRKVVRISDPEGGDDLETQLADEAQMVLKGIAALHTADELFDGLAVRREFETTLRAHLLETLSRLGFALEQVRFLDFEGERYAEFNRRRANLGLREKEGDLDLAEARQERKFKQAAARDELSFDIGDADITAERAKLNARLRAVATQDRLDKFKTDTEFAEFIRQTEHELGLKGVVREDEMQRLKERFAFDRSKDALLRRIEIEGITSQERRKQAYEELLAQEQASDERQRRDLRRQLEQSSTDLDRRRIGIEIERLEHAEQLRQAELQLRFGGQEHDEKVRRAAADQDLQQKKARAGIEMLRQVKQMEADEDVREQDLEAKRLAARTQASAAALISIMDGASPDKIVELERLRVQERMSPEQMLAMAAQASPDAARALAQRYASDGAISSQRAQILEQQLADQRGMSDGHADRMERMMQTALTQMGQVATTRAQAPQGPVVINAAGGQAAGACRSCGKPLMPGDRFCDACGTKQV